MGKGKKGGPGKKGKKAPKSAIKAAEKRLVTTLMRPKGKHVGPKAYNKAAASFSRTNNATSFTCKSSQQKSIVLRGTDFLFNLSTLGTLGSQLINHIILNPSTMVDKSRLQQMSYLWEKYRWKKLVIHYEPSVGTTTNGGATMCCDANIYDIYNDLAGTPLLVKMDSAEYNRNWQVAQPCTLVIKDKRFFNMDLFVNGTQGDARLADAGAVYIASRGDLASGTYGTFYVQWEIEFSVPCFDVGTGQGSALIIDGTGVYTTPTYPWGDFTNIIANFALLGNLGYSSSEFIQFSSNPITGSEILFVTTGFYQVTIYQTGAAFGSGAFGSEVTYTNCNSLYPLNNGNLGNPENFVVINGGLTLRMWNVVIYAAQLNATMTCTGDSGVTHNSSYVYVSKLGISVINNLPNVLAEKTRFQQMFEQEIIRREKAGVPFNHQTLTDRMYMRDGYQKMEMKSYPRTDSFQSSPMIADSDSRAVWESKDVCRVKVPVSNSPNPDPLYVTCTTPGQNGGPAPPVTTFQITNNTAIDPLCVEPPPAPIRTRFEDLEPGDDEEVQAAAEAVRVLRIRKLRKRSQSPAKALGPRSDDEFLDLDK